MLGCISSNLWQFEKWHTRASGSAWMPYNKDINGGDPMNNTELQELRQDILEEIEDMDIELLKRIAYECRCEENGIYPDQTYIRW